MYVVPGPRRTPHGHTGSWPLSHIPALGGFFSSVWVFCMHIHLCTKCHPGALGGQKMALEPLELELWAAVSHRMGTRNRTQVFRNSSQCT